MREIRGGVFQGRFHNLLISKNNTFWAPQISRITFQVVLDQQFFRVTDLTGDKVRLCRDGAGRHEEPVSWSETHKGRAVRSTIGPFRPPAHVHALLVDKDAAWAGEEWNPLVCQQYTLPLQPSGVTRQMPSL